MDKFKVGDRVKAGRKHGTISKFASETLCVVDYDRGEWDYWLMEDLKPLQPKKQPAALQADAPAEPPPAVTGDLCHRCGGDEFIDYHDFGGESTLERIPCPECQKRKQDAEDLQDMNEALSDFRETVRQIVGRNTQHKTHNITDVLERDYAELAAARARIAVLEAALERLVATIEPLQTMPNHQKHEAIEDKFGGDVLQAYWHAKDVLDAHQTNAA